MNPETESKSIHHIALRQPGFRRCAEKWLPPICSSPPGSPGAGDASAARGAPSHHARRDGAFRCPDPAIVELLQGEPIACLTGSEFWSSRKNHARHPDPAAETRGWWAGGAHPARQLTIAISARWASRRHRPRAASAPAGDRYWPGAGCRENARSGSQTSNSHRPARSANASGIVTTPYVRGRPAPGGRWNRARHLSWLGHPPHRPQASSTEVRRSLLLEHGYDQAAAVADILRAAGYREIVCHRDLAGHERVTEGRAPTV